MTKAMIAVFAVFAAALVPATASASCFFIYGPGNQLVYRSTIAPVDLSRPFSESVRGRFPGGQLVMVPDETGCPDLLANGESQLFATLGFSSRGGAGRSVSAIDASPLFRNASARPGSDSADTATSTGSDSSSASPVRRNVRPAPAGASRGK